MSCTCQTNPTITCVVHPASPPALTIEEFKEALPAKLKRSVNPALVQQVTSTLADPDMYENFRENLVSYTSVLKEGKFKLTNYVSAVKYVSYKLRNKTNLDAYSLTFPEKIQRFAAEGVKAKDVASYVSAYNKSKLVNLIMEQTLVPFYVLNQDLYQKALNTQAELMLTASSEKVRSDAANSVLTHLKPPETQKIELDVTTTESSAVAELRRATQELAAQQRAAISSGQMNAQEVAHSIIIEGEAEVIEG